MPQDARIPVGLMRFVEQCLWVAWVEVGLALTTRLMGQLASGCESIMHELRVIAMAQLVRAEKNASIELEVGGFQRRAPPQEIRQVV